MRHPTSVRPCRATSSRKAPMLVWRPSGASVIAATTSFSPSNQPKRSETVERIRQPARAFVHELGTARVREPSSANQRDIPPQLLSTSKKAPGDAVASALISFLPDPLGREFGDQIVAGTCRSSAAGSRVRRETRTRPTARQIARRGTRAADPRRTRPIRGGVVAPRGRRRRPRIDQRAVAAPALSRSP